ncbi:MAG: hypothetical protein ACREBF_00180 [Candidatus Micrarchaeales archaeon]
MKTVKKIGLGSFVRISTVLGVIFGIVAGCAWTALMHFNLPGIVPGAAAGGAVLVFVLITVIGAISGAVFALIGGWVYNIVASFIGGVQLDISGSPTKINAIGVLSYAKIVAAEALIFGIIGVLFTLVAPSIGGTLFSQAPLLGTWGGILLIGIPVLALVLGAIFAFVYALLYNYFAKSIGGIVIELSSNPTIIKSIGPISYAKIVTIIELVIQLIIGVVVSIISFSVLLIVTQIASAVIAAVFEFIFVLIGAALYNFIAGKIGGIQIVLE